MKGQIFQKQTGSKYDMRYMILTMREYEDLLLELLPHAKDMLSAEVLNNNNLIEIMERVVEVGSQINK